MPQPIDSHAGAALRSRLFSFHKRTINSDQRDAAYLGSLAPVYLKEGTNEIKTLSQTASLINCGQTDS
jgi:hypothetical protein